MVFTIFCIALYSVKLAIRGDTRNTCGLLCHVNARDAHWKLRRQNMQCGHCNLNSEIWTQRSWQLAEHPRCDKTREGENILFDFILFLSHVSSRATRYPALHVSSRTARVIPRCMCHPAPHVFPRCMLSRAACVIPRCMLSRAARYPALHVSSRAACYPALHVSSRAACHPALHVSSRTACYPALHVFSLSFQWASRVFTWHRKPQVFRVSNYHALQVERRIKHRD